MFKEISETNDYHKVLVFGASGVGKTRLLGTLPGRVAIVSAEGGLLSLRGKDGKYPSNLKVLDVNEIIKSSGKDRLPTVTEKLYRIRKVYAYLLSDEAKKLFDWVCVDSLSEVASIVQLEGKRQFPDGKNSFQAWNFYQETLTELIKVFRDLPYNIMYTCLNETVRDESGCRMEYPMISTKLQGLASSLLNEVFYYDMIVNEKGESKRKLVCQATSKTNTKDRSGNLEVYEEPDMTKIVEKMNKKSEPTLTKAEGETK
jgi:hypothetical protein